MRDGIILDREDQKKGLNYPEKKEFKSSFSRAMHASHLGPEGLSVTNLYELGDKNIGAIIKDTFIKQLQSSPSVKDVFFHDSIASYVPPINAQFVDNLACAVVCRSLSQTSLFGFSKTVDYQKCDNFIRTQFAGPNVDIETSYLYDYFFPITCTSDGHSFQEYLGQSGANWAKKFSAYVMTDQFLNVEIEKLIAGEPHWLYHLNLILYKLSRLDSSLVPTVEQSWKKKYFDLRFDWSSFKRFLLSDLSTDEFLSQIGSAISSSGRVISKPRLYPGSPHGIQLPTPVFTPGKTVYGENVCSFLKDKPRVLEFVTSQQPDNVVETGGGSSSPLGCFVGDSLLLLENDTIPIKKVTHKDRVVALNGAISTHTDERVITELKHEAFIYGINDDKPFFTAGHPFWTSAGWKAIDVTAALEENPSIEVKELKIGDSVQKIKSLNPLTYQSIQITQLTKSILSAGSKVYGLHLHDGPSSYHVNGYCVRMNYPIITERRLFDGFLKLSEAERALILRQLTPVMPLLTKAIGSFIEEPLRRSLQTTKTPSLTLMPQKTSVRKETLLDKPSRNYNILVIDEKTELHQENKDLTQLSLREGKLILNNQLIHHPKIRGNELNWCQRTKRSFTGGSIHFAPNWSTFAGMITIGEDQKSAKTYSVSGTIRPSVYTSTLQDNKISGSASQPGLSLRLSYIATTSFANITAIIECKDQKNNWQPILNTDIAYIGMGISEKGKNLTLNFANQIKSQLSLCYETFGSIWPFDGQIEFAWDGDSFSGENILLFDQKSGTVRTDTYTMSGKIDITPPTILLSENLQSDSSLELTSLSLFELISLIPDSKTVGETSNTMLVENMKWAIGDMGNGWLSDFFGQIRPDISLIRQKLVSQDLDFYQNKFAMAYLGFGIGQMTGPGAPSVSLSPEEQKKIKYFMTHGLAKEKAYTVQSIGIASDAFLAVAPGINAYLADNGEKWAEEVYKMITTNQKVNLMAAELSQDPVKGLEQMKQYAGLLSVLDPNSTKAQDYLKRMVSAGMFNYMDSMPLTDKDLLPTWVSDFISGFIKKYINATGGDQTTIRMKQLAQDLQDAIKTVGQQLTLATYVFQAISTIMKTIGPLQNFLDDTVIGGIIDNFTENHPTIAKIIKGIGPLMRMGCVIMAVFSLQVGFTNWKDIPDDQRAKTVFLTLQCLEPVMDLLLQVGKLGKAGIIKIMNCLKTPEAASIIALGPDEAKRMNDSIARAGEAGAEDAGIIIAEGGEIEIKEGSLMARLMSKGVAKLAFRCLGAALSVAFAGLATYTFAKDIINGAPIDQQAMDGIIAAATVGSALCEVMLIFIPVETVLGGLASVAGPVLALVGLIVMLVEFFKPQPKPESPTDKFMDGFRVFLASQDNPPADSKNLTLSRLLRLARIDMNDDQERKYDTVLDEKHGLSAALFLTKSPSSSGNFPTGSMPLTLWRKPAQEEKARGTQDNKSEKSRLLDLEKEEKFCCIIS